MTKSGLRQKRHNNRNPFTSQAARANRSAKKWGAIGVISPTAWRDKANSRQLKCWVCGCTTVLERGKPDSITPDHVMPLSCGGTNVVDNIEPSCFQCNRHKLDMPVATFKQWITAVYKNLTVVAGCRPE